MCHQRFIEKPAYVCMCVPRLMYVHVWHDSFICVTCLLHMYDETCSYVWHDWVTCMTWLRHVCDATSSLYVWHGSFTCVTRIVMTISDNIGTLAYASHGSHMNESRRTHERVMTYYRIGAPKWHQCSVEQSACMWRDSFICVTWLSHTRDMTYTNAWGWEVGGWGRDPKKCTGRDWGMGSSTI